jgi:hypothetical protein
MTTLSRVEYHAHQLLDGEAEMYQDEPYTPTSYHGNDFHASSYVECGRKQISRLLHLEPLQSETVIQWKRDAELGKVVHAYCQNLAIARKQVDIINGKPAIELKLKQVVSPEMKAELSRLHFTGTIDGILRGKGQEGQTYPRWLWEIKSISEETLNGKKQRYLPDKLAHYESQVQMYMHFTEIYQGILLVVSRERFLDLLMGRNGITWAECYQEFEIPYNPLFVERELERLETLALNLVEKTLPLGEPDREGRSCRFCSFPCEKRVK